MLLLILYKGTTEGAEKKYRLSKVSNYQFGNDFVENYGEDMSCTTDVDCEYNKRCQKVGKGNRSILQKFRKQKFAKRTKGKCINKNSELHSNLKNDTKGGKKKITNRSITHPSSSANQTIMESIIKRINKLNNVTDVGNSTDRIKMSQDPGKYFKNFHNARCQCQYIIKLDK